MQNNTVAIIGAGLMGSGIAACSTLGGHPTIIMDKTSELAFAGSNRAKQNLTQLLDNKLINPAQADAAQALLQAETDLKRAVKDSFLIIEAVSENLSLKQELFQKLDHLAPPDVIITSNTSGLRITDIAKYATHPERMVTTHFWFPAHLVPLVEVVMGEKTGETVAVQVHKLLLSWNKAPVIVKKDLPGQLANRILQAVIREAINIVQMGLATPEDVDTAIKMGMGIRFPVWGPLEHIDAVGLDLALSVQRDVLPGLDNNSVPPRYLQELVEQECLGYKTGKGFYDWQVKDMQELATRRDRFIIEALRILKTVGTSSQE
ncbi:MAG: 3-hydroxyacyl-CoA dehydrogenase NAD-binding domain-containing protein [Bellilinea sp.]